MFKILSGLAKPLITFAVFWFSPVWADENPDLAMDTEAGYRLHIHSQLQPLVINQIHSWLLELRNDSGPVSGAEIVVIGGMPEHDHGLPTQPQVTDEVEPGVYLIEGIRFHMPGAWLMEFTIRVGGIESRADLDFQL
jgi:hypothetical protein